MKRGATEQLRELVKELKHSLTPEEILSIVNNTLNEVEVPVSTFVPQIGALESVTVFLRENLKMSFKEIGRQLNRSQHVCSNTYRAARKKFSTPLDVSSALKVPLKTFSNREISPQRALVKYLKNTKTLKFAEIAKVIHRNERTVWTAYKAGGES